MIRITRTVSHRVEVYRAALIVAGRVYRESTHMSEQGARSWVAYQLRSINGV